MQVLCNRRKFCDEAPHCGGSKPHRHDPKECDKCPMDSSARCEEVTDAEDSV